MGSNTGERQPSEGRGSTREEFGEWSDDRLSTRETIQAMEIAEKYLTDVENITWQAADRTTDEELHDALLDVCERIWDVQNELEEAVSRGQSEETIDKREMADLADRQQSRASE